jgi:hypothetical protein
MEKLGYFRSAVAAVGQPTANSAGDAFVGSELGGEFLTIFPGDRVKHDLWGSGTVMSARGIGALVQFDYLGHRVFVSASALETL